MSPRQQRTYRVFLGAVAITAVLGPFQQALSSDPGCNPPIVAAACQAWNYADWQYWWYECWKPSCGGAEGGN